MPNDRFTFVMFIALVAMAGCSSSTQVNTPGGDNNGGTNGGSGSTSNGKYLFAMTDNGIFRSSDDGTSWTEADSGAGKNQAYYHMASAGQYIFVTSGTGVFRSSNYGTVWKPCDSGLSPMFRYGVSAIITLGSSLYLGASSVLYRSTDSGNTWQYTSGSSQYLSLAANDASIFAGTSENSVWVSTDNGGSWGANGILDGHAVQALAATGKHVFAGTNDAGLWTSTTNASVWIEASGATGVPGSYPIFGLYASGPYVFAGTEYATYMSSDSGVTWSWVTALPSSTCYAFTMNHGYVFSAAGYVRRSSDTGKTWQLANNGLTATTVYGFGVK